MMIYGLPSYASEIFSAELFSVEIPTGMISQFKQQNALSLVFSEDVNRKKGSITLGAAREKVVNPDIKWREVRATILGRQTKILFEKEIVTPTLTWKVIGAEGVDSVIGKAHQYQYYGRFDNSSYFLNYFCIPGSCTDIETAIPEILSTFQPK